MAYLTLAVAETGEQAGAGFDAYIRAYDGVPGEVMARVQASHAGTLDSAGAMDPGRRGRGCAAPHPAPRPFHGRGLRRRGTDCEASDRLIPSAEVLEFLARPNAAVMACLRPDGYPMSVVTWYDWDDGRILINMDSERSRLRWIRADHRVSFTGDVVEIRDDTNLADIKRICLRYRGRPWTATDLA